MFVCIMQGKGTEDEAAEIVTTILIVNLEAEDCERLAEGGSKIIDLAPHGMRGSILLSSGPDAEARAAIAKRFGLEDVEPQVVQEFTRTREQIMGEEGND